MGKPILRFFSSIMAAVLAVSLMPLPAFAEGSGSPANGFWVDEIGVMLASGDYIEGEAIVGFWEDPGASGLTTQVSAYEVEPLLEVAASAVDAQQDAVQANTGITTQSSDPARDVRISLVSSDSLSTEGLLRQLADDPRVAFAEPNYVGEYDAVDGESGAAAAVSRSLITGLASQEGVEGAACDLTQLQWGNSAKGAHFDGAGNTSINVPGFAEQDKTANMEHQIVVAVLDMPVDTENPDLRPSLYRFSAEQQQALGCGEWGYNATSESTDGILDVPTTLDLIHGTHVAGIIGAQWDGRGISGVASNVKIVYIENNNSNHYTSLSNNLRGYAFIKRYNDSVDESQRVKVVNNSWGIQQSSRAWEAAVTDLGDAYGTITVIAAGNSAKSNGLTETMANRIADNPYAIVVAALDASGTLSGFSDRGAHTVTLAAPGAAILSTTIVQYSQYIPDGALDTNICYEGFEGADAPSIWLLDSTKVEKTRQAVLDGSVYQSGAQGATLMLDAKETGRSVYYVKVEIPLDDNAKAKMMAAESLYIGIGLEVSKASNLGYIGRIDGNIFKAPLRVYPIGGSGYEGGNWGVYSAVEENDIVQMDLRDMIDEDALAAATQLDLTLYIAVDEPCEALHFDSIGIGSQKVPYAFMDGTSQAAPAVVGALAVLASQTGLSGSELVSYACSKMRIPESGALPLRMGGAFDFAVDGTVGNEVAPVISHLDLAGTTLTVWGENFGTAGTVDVGRLVVGKDFEPIKATQVKWSENKLVFELASTPVGIVCATVVNAAGKDAIGIVFAGKGESIYERDRSFTAGTGDPYAFDGLGDYETDGELVGLDGLLYYLPNSQLVEEAPAARRLLSYDPQADTWSELANLPEYLQGASATTFDGKLVVEGATMYMTPMGDPAGDFPEGQSAEERVYVYDPATNAWSQASTEGMHVGQTIVNDGGQLVLVGGAETTVDGGSVEAVAFATYGIDSGAGEAFCTPEVAYTNPQAVAKDGVLCLYDPTWARFMCVEDGVATIMDDALPDFLFAKDDELEDPRKDKNDAAYDPYVGQAILAVASEGIVLVGPPAKDGSSDTYILKDGAAKFASYAKRVSDARVSSISACAYEGDLFVIGSSAFEPTGRIFRSTALSTPASPGDAAHVHSWDAGKVTKAATAYTEGEKAFTCTNCGATKTEAISTTVSVGKKYAVSGSTYKVTSNGSKASQRTVTLTKAKAVKAGKSFSVPTTVKIKGASYKVTAIGSKAFNGSKATKIVVGSNVTSIAANSFYGAKKAKTIELGKNVSAVAAKSFKTNTALRTLTLKTTKLAKKAAVLDILAGSKVTVVKVNVGTKSQNKTYVKKYAKVLTKEICGAGVTVK